MKNLKRLLLAATTYLSYERLLRKKTNLVPAVQDSIAPVKTLLSDIMLRLQLQGQNFQVFSAATQDDMKELWGELEAIYSFLTYGGQYRRKNLSSFPSLVEFLSHCCQSRHYSFMIKKCGQHACTIYKPVRMPLEDLKSSLFSLTQYLGMLDIIYNLKMYMELRPLKNTDQECVHKALVRSRCHSL